MHVTQHRSHRYGRRLLAGGLREKVIQIEGQRDHLHAPAVLRALPLLARAIDIELDPEAIGVAQVDRFGDSVVGDAIDRPAALRQTQHARREIRACGVKHGEVKQPRCISGSLRRAPELGQHQQRMLADGSEQGSTVLAGDERQTEYALVEVGAASQIAHCEVHGGDAQSWVDGRWRHLGCTIKITGSVARVNLRKLGSSGIEVSEISLGSWLTYSGGVAREQAQACVKAAFEAGINFIDTANVYGAGAAESLLGEVLADYDRSSYVLATKVYFSMSATDRGLSAAQIHKQIDASLQRLRTDHVDLYQCHRYDDQTPLEETMGALTEVVAAGKARHIGFSEWPVAKIRESLALPDVARWISSQPQYSMLWRAPEAEVIPLCEAEEISQIVWSPLGQGVLTGKYHPGEQPPSDSRAASASMSGFIDRLMDDRVLEAVQRLLPIAEGAGLSMAQLALAWVLRQPNVASAIVGASRPEQVHANASASGIVLDASTLAAVDEALGDVVVR